MNWALLGNATQSTTFNDSPASQASHAVDGIIWTTSTTYNTDDHPWWKVRLALTIWVTHVEIVTDDRDKGMYLLLSHIPGMLW